MCVDTHLHTAGATHGRELYGAFGQRTEALQSGLFVIRNFLASAHERTEKFKVRLATADAFTVQS